ncbi:MAG: redoxin domain-containing protein [Planctomycetes bacterium]|nr:redoxin domain-containing protein [Planctomycetota bacterium]
MRELLTSTTLLLCLGACVADCADAAPATPPPQDAQRAATPPSSQPAPTSGVPRPLVVGDQAPPITVTTWLQGPALALEAAGGPKVVVLLFVATESEPCRASLAELDRLHNEYAARGVAVIGLAAEPVAQVGAFVTRFEPALRCRLAADRARTTTAAYCDAVGVGFVPYAFVIGPQRQVAWHGHPQQPELRQIVTELLSGTYDRERASRLVSRARSVHELETTFRDACAEQAWHAALLALDALLDNGAPPRRLLRYKLSILLGELGQVAEAEALARELQERYADDAAFLNSVAWDVVSDPRLYVRAPGIGLRLARVAYRASAGKQAAVADTYARALYVVGRVDLAAQMQRCAVALSWDEQKEAHQLTLGFYERCLSLQAEVDAEQALRKDQD